MFQQSTFVPCLSLSIAATFFFAGCQKESLSGSSEDGQVLPAAVMKAAARTRPSDADPVFDKAAKEIMHDMMQQMQHMEMTCDPDIDFAHMMIMHHEAGIRMSEAELQYGHESEAKMMAQEAIKNDEASLERLEAFLASHPVPVPLSWEQCHQFMKEMDEAMRAMMHCMSKAPDTEDVDVDFAHLTICHHQGALDMSEIELRWGNDAAARAEAALIIEGQSRHIMELQEFIQEHGVPSLH